MSIDVAWQIPSPDCCLCFVRSNQPEEVPRYSRAVNCDVGGRKKNRVEHQRGHDWVQELIWGI